MGSVEGEIGEVIRSGEACLRASALASWGVSTSDRAAIWRKFVSAIAALKLAREGVGDLGNR